MTDFTIRELSTKDLEDYKYIRLKLLKEHPTFFGSSVEEESSFSDDVWVNRLDKKTANTFAVYQDDTIVGVCVLVRNPRKKMKHIASIHSMYVDPKYRGYHHGKKLIAHAISIAKKHQVERLNLSVESNNTSAIKLYTRMGFQVYGEEPKTIKHNGIYYNLKLMSLGIK